MQYIKKIFLFIFIILNHNICTASYDLNQIRQQVDQRSWQAARVFKKETFFTQREKAILFAACNVQYTPKLVHSSANQPHQEKYYHTIQCDEFVDKIKQNFIAPVVIKLVNQHVGYGVFAKTDIPKGSFVGEFTGEFKKAEECATSVYFVNCFIPNTKANYVIDASYFGNEMRFINDGQEHSNCCGANVLGDDCMTHMIIVAAKNIQYGQQLTMPYHNDYWHVHGADAYQSLR